LDGRFLYRATATRHFRVFWHGFGFLAPQAFELLSPPRRPVRMRQSICEPISVVVGLDLIHGAHV
jgi:hypothetical protein